MVAAGSILAMQSIALKTGSKSDYFGRAAGILQSELELRQAQIIRGSSGGISPATCGSCTAPAGDPNMCALCPSALNTPKYLTRTVHVVDPLNNSALTITGDKTFTVKTTVTNTSGTQYLIKVQVTWTGTTNGIKSSMIVINSQ
jgi:hypothetical protein